MADSDSVLTDLASSDREGLRWRRRRCRALTLAGLTVVIVLFNAGESLLLYQWQKPQTVSFDMAGTVNHFMAQVAGGQFSDEQIRAMTVRFNAALSASLTDWQQHHGAVVLVAPAVVGGAADITPDIQADVAERMARE